MAKVQAIQLQAYVQGIDINGDGFVDTGLFTFYYCDTASRGWCPVASGTPGNAYIEPRIIRSLTLSQSLFGGVTVFGSHAMAYGEIGLTNRDGGLNYLQTAGVAGRQIKVFEVEDGYQYGTFAATPLFVGVMEAVHVDVHEVSIKLKDSSYLLQQPFQTAHYGGTNTPPSGVDGGDDYNAGRAKPYIDGRPYNFAPPLVNNVTYIYQIADYAITEVEDVLIGGVSAGTRQSPDYGTLTGMQNNSPVNPHGFRVYAGVEGTFVRLRVNPGQYEVTVNCFNRATFPERNTAEVFQRACQRHLLSFDTASITVLNSQSDQPLGLVVDPEANGGDLSIAQVLTMIAESIDAYWWVETDGVIYVQQLNRPSIFTPIATLDNLNIKSIERVRADDVTRGVPVWKSFVRYKRCWRVQRSGLNGAVTDDQRAFIGEEWRRASAEDASIKTVHPEAKILRAPTLLISKSAADTEAARRLNLHKTTNHFYSVDAEFESDLEGWQMKLGKVILLKYPTMDLANGRNALIIGRDLYDGSRRRVRFLLWVA